MKLKKLEEKCAGFLETDSSNVECCCLGFTRLIRTYDIWQVLTSANSVQNIIHIYGVLHTVFILSILKVQLVVLNDKSDSKFHDRMTVHRKRFLVNKTNRCTEIQFYWYYDSTCFGQPFCPSSGVLSRTLALVHFMQF